MKYALPTVLSVLFLAFTPLLCFAEDEAANCADCQVEDALEWVSPDQTSPNFTFKSANKKFAAGFGGFVKATAAFDWGNPLESDYCFTTSGINPNPVKGNGAEAYVSARESYLYFSAVALPDSKNRVGAFVGFNFENDNYTPLLQYAYLKWRNFTAGYDYTIFCDMDAEAPHLEYQGANSFTGIQNATLHLQGNLTRDGLLSGGVGLDMPIASFSDGDFSYRVTQRLPDIPAYIQANFGESHVRFSAILRNLYYHDLVSDRNNDKLGWGLKVSGKAVAGPLSLFWQALYGKGITSYYQDLTDCELDLVADPARPGVMKPLESWGGYFGFQYDFSDSLHLGASASMIRLYPDGDEMPDLDTTYRRAVYANGMLCYDISDSLSAGVEYIYGLRKNLDGASRHDNRLECALIFSF